MQETGCPLYPSVAASEHDPAQDHPTQDAAHARQVQGLMQYTRQTLQQYTNGATLRGMMTKQERALENMQTSSASSTELPGVSGSQKISPQMRYMQNLTRIVLLTIESLQQQDLVPPRSVLIPKMRQSFGMAEAGAVAQNMCAHLPQMTPFSSSPSTCSTECGCVCFLDTNAALDCNAVHASCKNDGDVLLRIAVFILVLERGSFLEYCQNRAWICLSLSGASEAGC